MDKRTMKDVLYLAALFHDIGKFRQRGKMDESFKASVRKEYEYEMSGKPQKGLAHEYIGAHVYKNSRLPLRDDVSQLIVKHHSGIFNLYTESDVLAKILKIADIVSAYEREEYGREELLSDEEKLKLMRSIIASVPLKKEDKPEYYKPVSRFSRFDKLLSLDEARAYTDKDEYEKLWKEFNTVVLEDDLSSFYNDEKTRHLFFERIYYLLKEYTSNVPSAFYYSEPDISLFSHSTSTAAIAISLFEQLEEQLFTKQNDYFAFATRKLGELEDIAKAYMMTERVEDLKPSPNDEPLLGVIKGDISGIQTFIYKVPNEHGLKKLRGRSFFIAYLAEILARYIVEKEGLYISNILFCGGGHFYILVPAKTIDRIEEYQRIFDEKLFKVFGTDLSVLVAGKKLNFFEMLKFQVHDELAKKLDEKKNKKYSLILDSIFEMHELSGPTCPYCGKRMRLRGDETECEFCESFTDLGTKLVKNRFMKIKKVQEIKDAKRADEVFQLFGYRLEFTNEPDKFSFALDKKEFDPNESMYFAKIANYVYKELKQNVEIVKDLEEIAKAAKGIKRWGILRGDMDNLGSVFRSVHKLSKSGKNSISRTATLSSEIELFFSVKLEKFISENHSTCNVVYSGGDDFMIVGPWSELVPLAWDLFCQFREYSKNDELSISMAVAVSPSRKYPVYKLGVEAGEDLENLAKSYKRNGLEKATLSIFNDCIGWEEYEDFAGKKKQLEKLIVDHGVTRNLLHVLKLFAEKQEKGEPTKIWRLYYYVARLIERQDDEDEEVKEDIRKFFNEILVHRNMLYSKLKTLVKLVHDETREVKTEAER